MPARHSAYPDGTSRYAGRSTRRYKTTRATFRTECADPELPNHDGTLGPASCWLCGSPIDYDLPYPHPESWTLDHAIVLEQRPDLAEDPANYRPAHKHCNEERGDRPPFIQLGQPSEDW